jgi:hypothetical protein
MTYRCADCQVIYLVEKDEAFYIQYDIDDNTYYALSMFLSENTTTVYISDNDVDKAPLRFHGVYPTTKPKDVLALAKRLHNLISFS